MAKGLCNACYQKQWERGADRWPKEIERKRQYREMNRDSVNAKSRSRRANNRGKGRDYWLRSNYGLTLEEYNILHDAQGGLCVVCYRPETRRGRDNKTLPLVVDHSHTSNRFRGLLCHACNVSLGLLDENPDRMRALAVYIEEQVETD